MQTVYKSLQQFYTSSFKSFRSNKKKKSTEKYVYGYTVIVGSKPVWGTRCSV
jgi:hypothetical protein